MAQVYRERDVRYTRDDSPSSDDDKYTTTTVRRYKVSGGSQSGSRVVERDRYEEDDDRRSHSHSFSNPGRPSGGLLEVDRRVERTNYPERPRSVLEPSARTLDHYRDDNDRYRTVEYEHDREVDRDYYNPGRHSRTKVVEEASHVSSHSPRDKYWDRQSRTPWDELREGDVHVDKRVVRREPDGDLQIKEKTVDKHRDTSRDYDERDLRIERHTVEERSPHDDIERYRREVDYYAAPDPPPAPVIVRNKAPEQNIVIHEAPSPTPVIVPRQEPTYIVLRDHHHEVARRPEPREDDDYYRREERRRQDDRRRSSDSYDEDYYVKRTIIKRDRSGSFDHHRRRHLAEGALAGAGLGALVGRGGHGKDGEYHDHRGRKVLAGAALGALGTEAIRRARSAYEDRYGDRYDDGDDYYRRHHHHRSKSRSRLATGLAIGAAALAVAGGLKYMQDNKAEKEEATRGRARRRHSVDDYSRSPTPSSRGRSHSKSNMAKAGLATGAVAGLVNHYRSKSRGKSRSKSRLRTGAEIAAAGLTGAAASKLWENHKEKKEREHHRETSDEHHDRDLSSSRSRSKSRSHSRHSHSRDSTADRELGLVPVEYGSDPLDSYDSTSDERRHRPHRHRRTSSASDREAQKKRSHSRLREVAAAGLGTAAAAIGIKKYQDRQKSKERDERSRERSRDRSLGREDRDRDRERDKGKSRRSRDRERRRYEEEAVDDPYYNYDAEAPPSPPHASGGAYYPPEGPVQPPPAGPAGFTQHPNTSSTNVNAYQPYPYDPPNYPNLPPPPAGPPNSGPTPPGPENVSPPYCDDSQPHPNVSRSAATEQDGVRHRGQPASSSTSRSPISRPAQIDSKVRFIPLSPQSSRTLQRHRERTSERSAGEANNGLSSSPSQEDTRTATPFNRRRRAGSDESSNRPRIQRRRRRHEQSPDSDNTDIEYLPDRFDASGRPLDPTAYNNLRRGGNVRRGSFEYRPRHPNDWDIRGAWMASGDADTDPDLIIRDLARTFGGLLHGGIGMGSGLMGLLGNTLEGNGHGRVGI
ncbi:hypothetical protein F4779DRAFT_618966 [Xylariaceae sp. FL0662B]|nr:hypothetical protein F4779DRAFT_618966 [Xylariaceae sp. FL0662B]